MKVYGYFRSSAAFRLRIALNLKKLEYESGFIHLRRGDQRQQAYLAVKPAGIGAGAGDRRPDSYPVPGDHRIPR
jgi:Glutathione S-transferase, N-terminal domain